MATTETTVNTTVETPAAQGYKKYADEGRVNEIKNMFDAQLAGQKSNLEASYTQNLSALEDNRSKIASAYQTQRNAAATDYERQRRNFNEQAMANGLNTGTGAQAGLAQNAAFQRMAGQLAAVQAQDSAANDRSIANLKVKYTNDINSSIADNDYKKAAALLDEYNNSYSQALSRAQTLAQYGDFTGFADVYGQDAATQMSAAWEMQNPVLAYNLGRIDAAKYKAITGENPPGYSASGGSLYRVLTTDEIPVTGEAASGPSMTVAEQNKRDMASYLTSKPYYDKLNKMDSAYFAKRGISAIPWPEYMPS